MNIYITLILNAFTVSIFFVTMSIAITWNKNYCRARGVILEESSKTNEMTTGGKWVADFDSQDSPSHLSSTVCFNFFQMSSTSFHINATLPQS